MEYLKIKDLPPRLTQFKTLEDVITSTVDSRIHALAKLHAYPVPGHMLGHIRNYISPNRPLAEIKERIRNLRDVVKFASEILYNLTLVQFEKYQLDYSRLSDHVLNNQAAYGYTQLTPADLTLVTHLLLTNEIRPSSWVLDMAPIPTDNLIVHLAERYRELGVGINFLAPLSGLAQSGRITNIVAITSALQSVSPSCYVTSSDDISTIVQQPAIRNLITEALGSASNLSDEDKALYLNQVITSESTIQRLADIRLVDTLAQMMLSVDTWHHFIPTRTKSDSAQNLERANGLRDFAAFLHSLLIYPNILRSELFIKSYKDIEEWYGAMPSIPADVLDDYKKYVTAYDVLGAQKDAAALGTLHSTKMESSPRSVVSTHYTEFMHVYGVDIASAQALASLTSVSNLAFTDLQLLRNPAYDSLLLSVPISRFQVLGDVYARIIQQATFVNILQLTMQAILPAHTRFFNTQTLERLTAISLAPTLPWCPEIVSFPTIHKPIGLVTNSLGRTIAPYNQLLAVRQNEETIKQNWLFTLRPESDYLTMGASFTIDGFIASRMREQSGFREQSFYPSFMFKGAGNITTRALKSSRQTIEGLIETLTLQNFSYAERLLNIPVMGEKWATIFSSFAICYRVAPPQSLGTSSVNLSPDVPAGIQLVPIEGLGAPYGMSYSDLEALQNFTQDDFIAITPYFVIALLKDIPVPSHNMRIGEFAMSVPYYYFQPEVVTIHVDEFVIGAGLQHFVLRPLSCISAPETILFDKAYMYLAASLVIQANPEISLADGEAPGVEYSIKTDAWNHDKMALNLEYLHFGTLGGAKVTGDASSESSDPVAKLNKELEAEFNKVLKDSNGPEGTSAAPSEQKVAIQTAVTEIKKVNATDTTLTTGKEHQYGPSGKSSKPGKFDKKKPGKPGDKKNDDLDKEFADATK